MEKNYRIQNLLIEYIPELVKLFGYSFNWAKEDFKFDQKFEIRERYMKNNLISEMIINTSLYDLVLEAKLSNGFALEFTIYINSLISEILKLIPDFKSKIKKNLIGTINNLNNWNYLNPIGELACLKKLLESGLYDLKEIECSFENNSTKDFLFTSKSDGKDIIVEVLNIHSKFLESNDFNKIKEEIFYKINIKVKKETKGVPNNYNETLFFLPVLWHINKKSMLDYYNFFKEFKVSFGKELKLNYYVCGFQSFLIIDDKFEFGEISSLVDRINYVA